MAIVCDYREHDIINNLKAACVDIEVQNLDVGDFSITNTSGYSIVIERKTLDDLSASIIDGRYKEQKLRLDSLRSNGVFVLFIIENTAKTSKKGVPHSTLLSAMLSTMLNGNFFVYRTKNLQETATVLQLLQKNVNDGKYSNAAHSLTLDYSAVHTKKSDNYTPKATYESMLSCVHGVSSNTARRISDLYPCLKDLMKAFEDTDESKRSNMLCNIDKIGPKISSRIFESLFG